MAEEPKTPKDKKEEVDPKVAEYQALVEKARDALKPHDLDVVAQMVLVLANGERVPIRGIEAQPVVVKAQKDESESKNADTGKGQDNQPVPETTD